MSSVAQGDRENADAAPAASSTLAPRYAPLRKFAPDLLWLLVAPLLYQLSIVRHELCHALGAILIGVPVTKIVVWPGNVPGIGFRGGYVNMGPTGSPIPTLAPYVFSIVTFPLFCWLYRSIRWRREWARMSSAFLGVVFPIIELVLAFGGGLLRRQGHVGVPLQMMAAPAVYAFGIVGCIVYVTGVVVVMVGRRFAG